MRLVLLTLLLASCASPVKFQKKTNGHGYTVKELSKDHFEILVFLPTEVNDETKVNYGSLAGIEECLVRGYEFVTLAEYSVDRHDVRCYSKNEVKMLGITFFNSGLNQSPRKFIVENTTKPSTFVQQDDVVLSIAGEEIFSMPQVKALVLSKGQTENALSIKLIRNDRIIEVKEPLTIMKGSLLGKANLETLRNKFK